MNDVEWNEIDPGHFLANTWTREAEIIKETIHVGAGTYRHYFTVYVTENLEVIVKDSTYTLDAAKSVAEAALNREETTA